MGKHKHKRNPKSNHAVQESNCAKLGKIAANSDEQNQQLSMQNDLMKERISRLEKEINRLNKMLITNADELDNIKKKHQEELSRSQSLETNLQTTCCELQHSKHTSDTLSEEKADLASESEKLHKEIKVLTVEKLNLQKKNHEQKDLIKKEQDKSALFAQQNKFIRDEKAALVSKNEHLRQEIRILADEKQKQKNLICQEQDKSMVVFKQNELISAQLNNLKDADQIARNDIALLKDDVNALLAVNESYKSENQAHKKKISGLEEEILRLQKINEDQANECIEIFASKSSENAIRIGEMDIRITQYNQSITKLKVKLQTQEVDFTQSQHHLMEDITQKNMQIDELHQQMKDNLKSKGEEIQSLIEQATKQEKGILALNKMMEESNRVIEDLQNQSAFRKTHTELLRCQMELKQSRKLLYCFPLPKKWLLNRTDVHQKLDVISQGVPGFIADQTTKQNSSKQTSKNE